MITKYYIDANGVYLGGFAPAPAYTVRTPQDPITDPDTGEEIPQPDLIETVTPDVTPPEGGIEVPGPPNCALDTWDFDTNSWVPYVAPVVYPEITARQLRLALLTQESITQAQVVEQIELITDPVEREAALIEWEYATSYERDHPLIAQIGAALGLSKTRIDELWLIAASL